MEKTICHTSQHLPSGELEEQGDGQVPRGLLRIVGPYAVPLALVQLQVLACQGLYFLPRIDVGRWKYLASPHTRTSCTGSLDWGLGFQQLVADSQVGADKPHLCCRNGAVGYVTRLALDE
jgi:hypothetical protein